MCLLSEEAAENGANFGASPQCTVGFTAGPEFDTSAQPKPQLSSFPAQMQLQHCIKSDDAALFLGGAPIE